MGSTPGAQGPWSDLSMSATPAGTAAVVVHKHLTTEAGAHSASAAAAQAKVKLQKRHQTELLEAALTPPQQRTQGQIEQLCDFLSTAHLLRSLQPTVLKSLAHAMTGQCCAAGDAIYRQGDPSAHLYVVVSGEVVMYESDTPQQQQVPEQPAAAAAAAAAAVDRSKAEAGSMHSSSGSRGSTQGSRLDSGSGGAHGQHSPSGSMQCAASPSGHKPAGSSPRRLGSSAGRAGTSAGSAAAGASPRGFDSSAGSHRHQQFSEVRRVKPREAFGEDDVTAHTRREQTAVSTGATRHTFAPPGDTSSSSSSSSSSSKGPSTAGAGSQSSGGGGAAPPTGPARTSGDGVTAAATAAGPAVLASGAAAAAAAEPHSWCVLLVLSAEDYGAALEGRLTSLLEQKVTFLASLPAMKGLGQQYLRALSHCFHTVNFEPREVVVRQGDVADCMYVIKSGQVCILIDPSMTLAEGAGAEGSSRDDRSAAAREAGAGGNEIDTKKLVQVCLLGGGAIIGDMSVREAGGAAPRRTATVVALTELVTYKVPLKEFKRRMPADVLEGMRQVADQKLEMNGSKAQGRALANGRDGQVLLGGLTLPECVLQGKSLRALLDAQEQVAPVGGLVQALELCVAGGSSSRGKANGSSSSSPGQKLFVSGTKAAADVESFITSFSRNGFLAAPPDEFLALLTDWRSARTHSHAQPQQVPPGYVFPLPLPGRKPSAEAHASAAALAAANSHLHPAQGARAALTHAAPASRLGASDPWADPCVTTHTVYSRPGTPQQQSQTQREPDLAQEPSLQVHQEAGGSSTAAATAAAAGATGASLASNALMSSPTSLLAALSLDQYVVQQSPLGSPSAGSRHASRPTTPAAGGGTTSRSLNAAAVAREAAQQLSPRTMTTSRAAGGMGSNRGTLLRGPAAGAHIEAVTTSSAAPPTKGSSSRTTEPTAADAKIKAASLFRPGSPICVKSPRPQPAPAVSPRHVAALPLQGLAPGVHAAVVTGPSGKQELTFHAAAGPGSAQLQLPQ